jgi:hypothetical protein
LKAQHRKNNGLSATVAGALCADGLLFLAAPDHVTRTSDRRQRRAERTIGFSPIARKHRRCSPYSTPPGRK